MSDAEQILLERAARLAEPEAAGSMDSAIEVLVCRAGRGRYAIDLQDLQAVQRPRGLTPVPSAASQIVGVLNVRGELLAVLGLAALLGHESQGVGQDSMVLLVPAPRGSVGILVDDVLGVQSLRLEQLDQPLVGDAYTRGIADGHTALLDLRSLLVQQTFGETSDEVRKARAL
jgi:purine-binding chemotaxis protein CheW